MKAKGIKFAVDWIALNDAAGDPDALEAEVVAGYISTLLVADIFNKDPEDVALRVVRRRRKFGEGQVDNG